MRIGIDAACWSNPRGYGRFTREMLQTLIKIDKENDYILFADTQTVSTNVFPSDIAIKQVDLTEAPTQAASASGRRSILDMLKMSRAVLATPLDLFFFPSVYTYFPVFGSVKKVVGIHDVIAEKFPELTFSSKKNKFFWDAKCWLAVQQADLVLTVSQFSKRGIAEHFGIKKDKIRVVTEGFSDSFGPIYDQNRLHKILTKYGLTNTSRYILYVGGIAPHKNLKVLVKAVFDLTAADRYRDIKLVIVGDYKDDVFLMDEQLKSEMKNNRFKEKVVFTGYIPDYELNCFYNAALVFVAPSICEGFGLPVLEAMACGTVAIGSNTTSIPEVAGDAALYFDPNNDRELREKLTRIIDDRELRKTLSQRSLQRAALFSWEKSASETKNILTSLTH